MKAAKNTLETACKKCFAFIEECNTETQAPLLFNYILAHRNRWPSVFAYPLLSSVLQEEFIRQIRETGKVRALEDVLCLMRIILNTPALNQHGRRISKKDLFFAVTDLLIGFMEEEKGIYSWDEQKSLDMKFICGHLPTRCIKKLQSYLIRKRKTLMCEEIDKLIRFKIFLKDKQSRDIIDGILSIIES